MATPGETQRGKRYALPLNSLVACGMALTGLALLVLGVGRLGLLVFPLFIFGTGLGLVGWWRERRARPLALFAIISPALAFGWVCYEGLSSAMGKTAQSLCLSTEQSLAEYLSKYADEHNETLPPAATWLDDLIAVRATPDGWRAHCGADRRRGARSSYAFNPALSGVKLADIKEPDKVVLVFEADIPGDNPSGPLSAAVFRHFGGLNVTFVDGHTTWRSKEGWPNVIQEEERILNTGAIHL